MEVSKRLAWYGFFAVSTLYITGSRAEGALGFTSEQRGMLPGIVPFILYLLPVVFGALGDRFGYKKTFFVAYTLMVPAYYLLGQFTAFGTFFMAFLFVAVGAAIFKPVVGTVARTTDETDSSMGFGIFYMMVNIGGFVGPIVAGIVRVRYGWDWVFIASSFWIACNFIWLLVFYKEPTTEAGSTDKRSLKQVFSGIVEVLGNKPFLFPLDFLPAHPTCGFRKVHFLEYDAADCRRMDRIESFVGYPAPCARQINLGRCMVYAAAETRQLEIRALSVDPFRILDIVQPNLLDDAGIH